MAINPCCNVAGMDYYSGKLAVRSFAGKVLFRYAGEPNCRRLCFKIFMAMVFVHAGESVS